MQKKPLAAIALVSFLLSFAFGSLLVVESAPTFKQVAAGKAFRVENWQGWSKWSDTLYFTAYSRAGTGAINDFANVKLGAAGYVMPRLGWCVDTLGQNITLTGIAQYSVDYTVTGASSVRLWCPDRGEPVSAAGSAVLLWDALNQVATINTAGATPVTVTWTPASVTVDYTNFFNAFALLSVVPIAIGALVVIGVLSGSMSGDNAAAMAIVAVVFAIAGILAVVVLNALITA